jgi:hypothetical protein
VDISLIEVSYIIASVKFSMLGALWFKKPSGFVSLKSIIAPLRPFIPRAFA